MAKLKIMAYEECPACRGTGMVDNAMCWACQGIGVVPGKKADEIREILKKIWQQ